MEEVPEREELEEKYKWDVESVFSSEEEWRKEREEVEEKLEQLTELEARVAESPEKLLEALELYEEIYRRLDRLTSYARMRRDEDTRRESSQALNSRAKSFSSEVSSSTSFVETEIQEAGEEAREMLEELEELQRYSHHIDDLLRRAEHTRSKEVEEVLADLSEVTGASGNIYEMLTNSDIDFPEVEGPDGGDVRVTLSNFTKLLRKRDRDFRRRVHESFFQRLGEYRNTVSSTLETHVKSRVKHARIRGYGSAREASLDSDNLPVEVYDNLVGTIYDNVEPLQRHMELKRRVLDQEQLHVSDVYVPLDAEDPEVGYEEAKDHVLEAIRPLGEDYRKRAAEGLKSGWVDVYETEGKRSGAYSGGAYDTKPFILMNYKDDVSSMYTLAHELGHSMHSELTTENQPYIYSGYPIFLAEIASTVNEALLTEHLLENGSREMKRAALSNELENFRTTLYRQTMFARFEQMMHERVEEGDALTAGVLDELFLQNKSHLYSSIELDDQIQREWMRIPHFFRYRQFYVFQYSTGMSSALSLSRQILEEGPERYLEMLKAGSSDYPLELLENAGVRMESRRPFRRAVEAYGERLDEMEKLL